METILIEIEQLNIGMTSLVKGTKCFQKKGYRYNNSKNYKKTIIIQPYIVFTKFSYQP